MAGSITNMIAWFREREGQVVYSQANRLGPTSYDCSSAVYFSLIAGGFLPEGSTIGWTGSLETTTLPAIATKISASEVKKGDIFLTNPQANAGHTGVFTSSTNIIHCNAYDDGITETVAEGRMGSGDKTFWRLNNSSDGGDGGDDGGDSGGDEGGETPVPIDGVPLLKVNGFNSPQLVSKKLGKKKYGYVRQLLNSRMKEFAAEAIQYINDLQGDYGLEKICCAPFLTLVLTNGKGVQKNVNLANFRRQSDPFDVGIQAYLGRSNRVEFFFKDFLALQKDLLEAAIRKDSLMDQTPKNFELYVDSLDAYEYFNKHTIQQSLDNAAFSRSQSFIAQDNETRNFNLQQANTSNVNQMNQMAARKQLDLSQSQEWANYGFNAVGSITGAATHLFTGNVGAAAGSLATGLLSGAQIGVNQGFNDASLQMSQQAANQALAANQQTEKQVYMNNLETSQLIASNNYENTIANINAGLNDIKSQPDVSAITGSDYNFELGWDNDSLYMLMYTIAPQALVIVAEYFARFGYSVRRYGEIENYLRVRTKFNYVKTQGANVRGNVPVKWRNSLNMIFDSGITFWRDHSNMRRGEIRWNYAE